MAVILHISKCGFNIVQYPAENIFVPLGHTIWTRKWINREL